MIQFTIYLPPVTKKNSQRIVRIGGYPKIVPSKAYEQYEKDCMYEIPLMEKITGPVNVECKFYMPTRRRVDLVNLLEAIDDVLVAAGVVEDDNSQVIAGHDGSRVFYDKHNPRTEVRIWDL